MQTLFQWLIDLLRDARFWFVVEPWEKAVRVRAGKNALVMGPGIHFKWPMIDEVYIINTRLRLGNAASQTISSADGKVVTVGTQLGFSIHDPLLALNAYQKPEASLSVLVHNFVADYIVDRAAEEIVPSDMEDYILSGLKDVAPNDGIEIEFVKVTTFVFSSPARTFRLINDDNHTDWSSEPADRSKWQPNVLQW